MKKSLYLLVTIFMFTLFSGKVFASSFTLTLDGDNTFTDEVSIDIIVNNISGFTNGFYGLDATLSYDKAKLELKEITKPATYELTYDTTGVVNRFVVLTGNSVSNGTKLATVTFRNKALTDNEAATVSLTNLIASDGEDDVSISNTFSKTLTKVSGAYMKGDMNKNGKIDLSDIIALLKVYLNGNPTPEQVQIGDMDGNTSIGLRDIILLLKEYLKN